MKVLRGHCAFDVPRTVRVLQFQDGALRRLEIAMEFGLRDERCALTCDAENHNQYCCQRDKSHRVSKSRIDSSEYFLKRNLKIRVLGAEHAIGNLVTAVVRVSQVLFNGNEWERFHGCSLPAPQDPGKR